MGVLITLDVHSEDMGKIIGLAGQMLGIGLCCAWWE